MLEPDLSDDVPPGLDPVEVVLFAGQAGLEDLAGADVGLFEAEQDRGGDRPASTTGKVDR